jgi:hypothetical protein
MVSLASNRRTVTKNILRFADKVRECPGLADRLAAFRAWYAEKDEHGHWHFGPSKVIGYAGLDGDEYLSNARRMDGRKTEKHLQAFFRTVEEDTPLHEELDEALWEFLGEFDKFPSKACRINVASDAYDEHCASDVDSAPLIDLIVAVARSLPSSQIKELRKRLKTMNG